MSTPIQYFVGWLLGIANRRPDVIRRDDFYAVKDRICREYGTLVGHDLQHIKDDCWTCNGTGVFSDYGYPQRCRKCWGTGIYREHWTRLERWSVGGRIFHRPAATDYKTPAESATIEGRIRHEGDSRDSGEATLWLYLIFAPDLFVRELTGHCYLTPGPRPLLWVQKAGMALSRAWGWLTIRQCMTCREPFIRPSMRLLYFECAKCARSYPRRFIHQEECPF